MKKNIRTKRGFTLMEMLIAMTVFVIFLVATSSSYLFLARTINDANQIRRVYSSAQSILNMIAKEVREGVVDYDCYKPAVMAVKNPTDEISGELLAEPSERATIMGYSREPVLPDKLCAKLNGKEDIVIRNKNGDMRFAIRLKDESIEISRWVKDKNDKWERADDYKDKPEGWEQLELPKNIKISDLRFRVTPAKNPFDFNNVKESLYQFQPQVTVLMEMETSISTNPKYILPIQTTVSSRVYNKLSSL